MNFMYRTFKVDFCPGQTYGQMQRFHGDGRFLHVLLRADVIASTATTGLSPVKSPGCSAELQRALIGVILAGRQPAGTRTRMLLEIFESPRCCSVIIRTSKCYSRLTWFEWYCCRFELEQFRSLNVSSSLNSNSNVATREVDILFERKGVSWVKCGINRPEDMLPRYIKCYLYYCDFWVRTSRSLSEKAQTFSRHAQYCLGGK